MEMAAESSLTARVKALALELGFDQAGVAALRPSDHAAFYRWWLDHDYHGEMDYLARPDAVERRLAPDRAWPALKSALVVSHGYYTDRGSPIADRRPGGAVCATEDDDTDDIAESGNRRRSSVVGRRSPPQRGGTGIIARYARGRDYHKVVKKTLMRLLRRIEEEAGRALPEARAYVDTGPVLERELARRAGLGWFGRNTMMIHPRRGSYFFLGVLLLPLELEADDEPVADHCGTCRACLDACPTGALLGRDENGAPVMDATRCISYLTIENRGPIPREMRPLMGNRVYGCDICQSVCPWNSPKLAQVTQERDYQADWREAEDRPDVPGDLPGTEAPSLVELMRMTREEWDLWTRGSAIRRAGYAGFKRNVAVAMGDWLASVDHPPEAAVAVLRDALEDEEPLVREHAAWALERTGEA